jgi:4-amino-4-deoxychorismate lyase
MAKQRCDDVLVLDHQNNVIEASAANIFAISDNKVYTPSLEQCGIKGVYLQSLCDKLAVEFKQVSLNELTQASAVFICNSLMGAVPVNRIEQHTFNVEQSMCLLNELLAKEAKC